MDPFEPASFHHKDAILNSGRGIHYVDQMPRDYVPNETRTLLLLHGFPGLWYEWRWQIPAWVARGWRVIAMDLVGFGLSGQPQELRHYTPSAGAADAVALLNHLGLDRATVVGHDWGAYVAWRMGLEHRGRVEALITMSVIYNPPAPKYHSVDKLAEWYPSMFGYWKYFCSPEAEAEIQGNLSNLFDVYYRSLATRGAQPFRALGEMRAGVTGQRKIWTPGDLMIQQEKDVYIKSLQEHGIAAPLRWYKSHRDRWEQERAAEAIHGTSFSADLPVLFIAPSGDQFASDAFIARSKPFIPALEVVKITSGHFVLQEKRQEISQIVSDWLDKVDHEGIPQPDSWLASVAPPEFDVQGHGQATSISG